MLLEINPKSVDQRQIQKAVDVLKEGGVVIIPTDSVYAYACDIYQPKAIEKICTLKGVKLEKANFSFVMKDLSAISNFTKPFDRSVFKLMNKALPGPYTFILNAGHEVPSIFRTSKKTIGLRVPDNRITQLIVETLGNPLMVSSVHDDENSLEYSTDPFAIFEKHNGTVELIVDGGMGNNVASTVVDCTDGDPVVIRQGIGPVDII